MASMDSRLWGEDDLAAETLDHEHALAAHALGHDGAKANTGHGASHRERDGGGPARGLDDDRIGGHETGFDRVVHDEARDAVFRRTARQHGLEFEPKHALGLFVEDADRRGAARHARKNAAQLEGVHAAHATAKRVAACAEIVRGKSVVRVAGAGAS